MDKSRIGRDTQDNKSDIIKERKRTDARVIEKKSTMPIINKTVPKDTRNIGIDKKLDNRREQTLNRSKIIPGSRERAHISEREDGSRAHRERRGHRRVKFEERSHVVKDLHRNRYTHIYRDRHRRLCHRIVWPRYHFPVYYSCGPSFTFRYVYPYYHRKYIFISLGGYWPVGYGYMRYYWYGYHPYQWYGYYPVPYEVGHDTYNYYTYNNYYYTDTAGSTGYNEPVPSLRPVDENTFADVRERLAQQQAEEPDAQTLADTYFEDAVKAFEAGDYVTAAELFAKAMELAPEDMILPYAYAQALFAAGQYTDAAEVLRLALANVKPEEEGVFYPRGLYPDDETLFAQIDLLAEKAELDSTDLNLQLLLGYQLLGIEEFDEAIGPLQLSAEDPENAAAAEILLDLLVKIRAGQNEEQ